MIWGHHLQKPLQKPPMLGWVTVVTMVFYIAIFGNGQTWSNRLTVHLFGVGPSHSKNNAQFYGVLHTSRVKTLQVSQEFTGRKSRRRNLRWNGTTNHEPNKPEAPSSKQKE